MRKLSCIASALAIALAGAALAEAATGAETSLASSATAQAQTQAVVSAATAFLDSLDAEQRTKVQFAFKPQKAATAATFARSGPPPGRSGECAANAGRPPGPRPEAGAASAGGGPGMGPPGGFVGEQYGAAVWSNFPVSDVPRPGLQLGHLSDAQRAAALRLLQALLGAPGYQKVLDIMGSDQALSEGGTDYAAGTATYTIGVFGTPSATAPWMLQFGGHHLGLNVVIAGSRGVLTPTLTGAQPSVYTAGRKTVRVLAGENDKAFALLDALDDPQRQQAILGYRVNDLVLGPGRSGAAIVPEGLKASAMTERQRALLLDVIAEWAGIVGDAYAAPRMAEIRAGLDDTWFAWSGSTTHQPGRNGSAYYRIQGPKLVIEFSPQGVGGDPAGPRPRCRTGWTTTCRPRWCPSRKTTSCCRCASRPASTWRAPCLPKATRTAMACSRKPSSGLTRSSCRGTCRSPSTATRCRCDSLPSSTRRPVDAPGPGRHRTRVARRAAARRHRSPAHARAAPPPRRGRLLGERAAAERLGDPHPRPAAQRG